MANFDDLSYLAKKDAICRKDAASCDVSQRRAGPKVLRAAKNLPEAAEYGIGARDNLEELGSLTTPDVEIDIDVEAESMASKHK